MRKRASDASGHEVEHEGRLGRLAPDVRREAGAGAGRQKVGPCLRRQGFRERDERRAVEPAGGDAARPNGLDAGTHNTKGSSTSA